MKIGMTIGVNVMWGVGLLMLVMCAGTIHAKKRIVTLAPALTEMVFALGEGENLVGNSDYCNFPEEAKKITRVGGHMDVNLEAVINLNPDIVFVYKENYHKLKILEQRAQVVQLTHSNLKDIYQSIQTIAFHLDINEKGTQLVAQIKKDLEAIATQNKDKKKLKTLLIIGRNPDSLTNMYIAGRQGFLNQLLELAGGVNAYTGDISYPGISVESVAAMKPDVIVELSAFNEGIDDATVITAWKPFTFIPAVKNKKIKIIKNAMWVIPGPRVAETARELNKILHH